MTKDEIATHIAENTGIGKASAEKAVNSLLDLIAIELRSGRDFMLRDIGTLKVKPMAARTGRNPHTGEEIKIPARKSVKLKLSQALANQLNA
ncbi:HU family DNA-binding protein [Methylobacterium organophilum]|uniref:HU family DNA-binding protein n=1 Tax=Methylobacterium TaxID=407 RepID=UPI0019D0FF65|nr:HU family DNA-binding protein [Methylobacterium organophilum]MBN6819538.1 HU family DNA-binding protein [Methylobacterium organophilum]